VAKAFPPITLNGVEYAVLRLDRRAFGPRFLLRDVAGRLFGYSSAAPMRRTFTRRRSTGRRERRIRSRGSCSSLRIGASKHKFAESAAKLRG
jgi:hypothetical protein